jgi:hypothetical protein
MIQAALVCVIFCFDPSPKPVVVSEYCEMVKDDIAKLKSLTPEELAVLQRPRKEAIRNLRQKYKRLCS